MDRNHKIVTGSIATAIVAIGVVGGLYTAPGHKDTPAPASVAHASIGERVSDLDYPGVVEPGQTIVATVRLPERTVVVAGSATPTKAAEGKFEIVQVQQDTDTQTLLVTAKNTSDAAVPFTATFAYKPH